MVSQLEGEQEFAVDVGEQDKADHGNTFNWVGNNGCVDTIHVIVLKKTVQQKVLNISFFHGLYCYF